MQRPEAVIFDIGNVLIRWDPDQLYAQVIPDAAERARLFTELGLAAMNEAIDRGAPWKETVYATAEQHPDHAEIIRLWHDRWLEMASPAIDESVAMLRSLRAAGIPCFALSNFGVETFDLAEQTYPFLKDFDRRYISGHMKVMKPEPEIYEAVERDCGLSGPQLFFTDDKAENVAAAAALGWQTHLFEGPEGLRAALAALHLPV